MTHTTVTITVTRGQWATESLAGIAWGFVVGTLLMEAALHLFVLPEWAVYALGILPIIPVAIVIETWLLNRPAPDPVREEERT